MLNQTLISGLISAGLVLLGQPFVEYIRGKNAKSIAARELRDLRITWWKDSIIEWQQDFLKFELDAQKFRTNPNLLLMLQMAPESIQKRFEKVYLPSEWSAERTEADYEAHQTEFLALLEELMKIVVEKELAWVLK